MHSSFNQNPPDGVPESYWQAASSARARRSTALPARTDVAVIGPSVLPRHVQSEELTMHRSAQCVHALQARSFPSVRNATHP